MDCNNCKEKQVKEDTGTCPLFKDVDGLPLRCIGFWAEEKLTLLFRYIDMFTGSQYNKWSHMAYIDMFSGPGKGIIRKKKIIIDGSPIRAFQQKHLFTHYVFIDINDCNIDALKYRINLINQTASIKYIPSDCNNAFMQIKKFIPDSALTLVFIDPTNMQIDFSTIRKLANYFKHIDMIINFPRQSIVRQYQHALTNMGNQTNFDKYFGTTKWRNCVIKEHSMTIGGELLNLYKEQLKTLQFSDINDTRDSIIVRGPRNIPLYELVFASRHPLAYRLFNESVRVKHSGQWRLPI
jgi:three-Cys-motif partner protein